MADAYVVDTAVFVRWFIDQPGYEHARLVKKQFLDGDTHLETVDFARIELAEVLRKKGLLTGRLDVEEFKDAARVIDDLEITVQVSDADRVERATDLAAQ